MLHEGHCEGTHSEMGAERRGPNQDRNPEGRGGADTHREGDRIPESEGDETQRDTGGVSDGERRGQSPLGRKGRGACSGTHRGRDLARSVERSIQMGDQRGGTRRLPGPSPCTVHFLLRDLPEDLQVGPVEDAAQDFREVLVLRPKETLRGHPVGNQPHAEEEQEEEHVLHLQEEELRPSLAPPFLALAPPSSPLAPPPHHLADDDDLGPQLFIDREDVQKAQREDHEVEAEDSAAQVIQARGQPGVQGERPG